MAKNSTFITLAAIVLDRNLPLALHRQLYGQLRQAILSRRLAPGIRLPPTRALAIDAGVSRNTVVAAFEQLLAEGYIEGRIGDGTYVSASLSDAVLKFRAQNNPLPKTSSADTKLSHRGASIAATPLGHSSDFKGPRTFRLGLPAVDEFPFDTWRQVAGKRLRKISNSALTYGEPTGYPPLRHAIATYIGASRGVRCTSDQVIIVTGTQSALDISARLLLDPGDAVWIEDPGYPYARAAFLAAEARLIPVPVDNEGLTIPSSLENTDTVRFAYVTPSNQFPMGVTMSLPRRLALLEWASRADTWILEDDYDSEYRYAGQPLTALQGLDTANRVIYLGTFSKVLFPALRLGYIVVPPYLVEAFAAAQYISGRLPPTLDQAVLTDFITEGHFARHLRRMRSLYASRYDSMLEAIRGEASDLLEVVSGAAGLHVLALLPEGLDDQDVSLRARKDGLDVSPLSAFSLAAPKRGGLALGYATLSEPEIREGIKRLRAIIVSSRVRTG